ncbi:hypothetical protein ACOSQ4_020742 [Xanthoceras sorbifolium]
MAQIKVVSCVLIVCLMLFLVNTDCKMASSPKVITPQATICCREHPKLSKCIHGKDDALNKIHMIKLVHNQTDIRPCMYKILKCSNETSVKSGVGEQLPIMQGQFGFIALT